MAEVVFFGKLPAAADFVRRGVSAPEMRAFENWFHDCYGDLRGAGEKGLPFPCHIVYPNSDEGCVIAAIAVPSKDRIGREFPAVVATAIADERLPRTSASWLLGFSRFWTEATAAIQAHAGGEPKILCDAVQALRPPEAVEVSEAADRWAELLANLGAREMEKDCFEHPGDRFYAYHTLLLATKDAPATDPRVLLCPTVGKIAYRAFWLETAQQATNDHVALPSLWLTGPGAPDGMLVSLGKAPAGMLRFAMGHGRNSHALWPLETKHEAARTRAKEALASADWDSTEQNLSRLIGAILSNQT
jgi:type VI secretion system ImpM family protein